MDIEKFTFKHYEDERFIATQPWYIALKRAKSGQPTRLDITQCVDCPIRSKLKLQPIDPTSRTPAEAEAWIKAIDQAETQARVRAVQMHFNVITMLPALSLSINCCDNY